VKDVYYPDVAFQKYCYEGAGLKIRKCHIIHINTDYVRRGDVDPKAIFTIVDVTDEVDKIIGEVEGNLKSMINLLQKEKKPEIKIGLQCGNPYECVLKETCWSCLPKDNLFLLSKIQRKKAFAMIDSGILTIQDVPAAQLTSAIHQIQRRCHLKNEKHIDTAAIRALLSTVEFPVYFLDFESVAAAIPLYDGSKPFQQIPFQFSLHIYSDWDKKPVHHAFLFEGRNDPRPELLKHLKSLIGKKGSIVAYNMNFEKRCLQESAEEYPEYQKWFEEIEPRFLDLMKPFQKFDYYDPKQRGRYSIKFVYPALVGGSYEGMEISDGGQASREYGRVTFKEGVSEEEKRRVYDGLLEYCALDTQAMIDVLDVLKKSIHAT
jgi:hypothetical protein